MMVCRALEAPMAVYNTGIVLATYLLKSSIGSTLLSAATRCMPRRQDVQHGGQRGNAEI